MSAHGLWSGVLNLLDKFGIGAHDVEVALLEAGLEDELMDLAKEAKEYWQSIAPVFGDKPPHRADQVTPVFGEETHQEAYKERVHIEVRPGRGLLPHIVVADDDPKAGLLEYGSIHNPEHGYCQQVVDHFGGGEVEVGWHSP